MQREEAMNKRKLALWMLRRRVCLVWPNCRCAVSLEKWAQDLEDECRVWEPNELQWIETDIFLSLACISEHCPDIEMKIYAKGQLTRPYWNRQKRLGMLRTQ